MAFACLSDLLASDLSDTWSDWEHEKESILVMSENGRVAQALRKLDEAQSYYGNRFRAEQPAKSVDWAHDLVLTRKFVREVQTKGADERLKQTLADEEDRRREVMSHYAQDDEEKDREQCRLWVGKRFPSLYQSPFVDDLCNAARDYKWPAIGVGVVLTLWLLRPYVKALKS